MAHGEGEPFWKGKCALVYYRGPDPLKLPLDVPARTACVGTLRFLVLRCNALQQAATVP